MESGRSIEEIQHAQLREARSIWAPPIAGRGGVRMSGFLGYVRTVDDLLTVDPWDLRLGLRLRIPLFYHVHVAATQPHIIFRSRYRSFGRCENMRSPSSGGN